MLLWTLQLAGVVCLYRPLFGHLNLFIASQFFYDLVKISDNA